MRKLVFSMNMSLDGYIEDPSGDFGWSVPDDEVHQAINDEHRDAGGYIYGRRMWEMMVYWGTDDPARNAVSADFAQVWQAVPSYVVSSTLEQVEGATLLRDPEADVARLKEEAGGPLYVGGAETAARLAPLIDQIDLYAFPVIVGGGKPAWTVPMTLSLIGSRTFASGVVHSRYDVVR